MTTIRATHTLGDLVSDMRKVPAIAVRDMKATIREATITGNTVARDNARRSSGKHGKHYPNAFTWETSSYAGFGRGEYVGVYGPDSSRRQGNMSFEGGSRNQKPHHDLARSADLIGPALAQEIGRRMSTWYWPR